MAGQNLRWKCCWCQSVRERFRDCSSRNRPPVMAPPRRAIGRVANRKLFQAREVHLWEVSPERYREHASGDRIDQLLDTRRLHKGTCCRKRGPVNPYTLAEANYISSILAGHGAPFTCITFL